MAQQVFQNVVNHDYVGACRYTGYENKSIRLKLECGHEIQDKASRFEGKGKCIPKRARCRDCEHQRANSPGFVGADSFNGSMT